MNFEDTFPRQENEEIMNHISKMNRDGYFTAHFVSPIRCINCSEKIRDPTHKCLELYNRNKRRKALDEMEEALKLDYPQLINMNVLNNVENIMIIDYEKNLSVEVAEDLDYYELLINGKFVNVKNKSFCNRDYDVDYDYQEDDDDYDEITDIEYDYYTETESSEEEM